MYDDFTIGAISEHINLIQHSVNNIQDSMPKNLSDLTDVAGKWGLNNIGDIIPEDSNKVSIGSSNKSIKTIFVEEIKNSTTGAGTNGYILASTGVGWTWTDPSTLVNNTSIENLSNVSITSASNNQILTYNGSEWVNSNQPASVSELNDLTDVTKNASTSTLIIGGSITPGTSYTWPGQYEMPAATVVVVDGTTGPARYGQGCTIMGHQAAHFSSQSAWYCTVIGHEAWRSGTGSEVTAIGKGAAHGNTGSNNVAVGGDTLAIGSGGKNVAIGVQCAISGTIGGEENIFIGYRANAGQDTSGSNNIIIGANTLASSTSVSNEITLGNSSNTLFRMPGLGGSNGDVLTYNNGYIQFASGASVSELNDLTDVTKNTLGLIIGTSITAGTSYPGGLTVPRWTVVVANGADATYGEGCTIMGHQAARYSTSTSTYCTVFGYEAWRHGNGLENTAIGKYSLFGNAGSYNTALGSDTLSAGSGSRNVALGFGALQATVNGMENTVIGYYANKQDTSGSNNIVIGANTLASSTSVSNEITLGNSSNTLFRMPGLGGSNGDVLTYNNGYIQFASGGGGGGTAVYFSATSAGTQYIQWAVDTPITFLDPANDPGPSTDATNVNCNSPGVTWNNGEVTIPTSGVYVIQMAIMVYDFQFVLYQSAVMLEKQKVGTSTWLKQTEEGWVNYDGGNQREEQTTRHIVGAFMGQFNTGDKLRLSAFAVSNQTVQPNSLALLSGYRGGTCYLRGHMINATP